MASLNLITTGILRKLSTFAGRCAGPWLRLGVAGLLFLVPQLLGVGAAQAQSDDIPTLTIRAASNVGVKGDEVDITISASFAPTSDVTVNIHIAGKGPTIDQAATVMDTLKAGSSTMVLTLGPITGEEEVIVTFSLVAGAGYSVGSPSSTSVHVLKYREDQAPEQDTSEQQVSPAQSPNPVIGTTSAATATVIPGDRLIIQRHDLPEDQPAATVDFGVGWVSKDGSRVVLVGVIRDESLGQTYLIVRHEGHSEVVRRWIPPYSDLVYTIDWPLINSQFSFPVEVIAAIPLDHRLPENHMLVRRFDGGDDRIFAYDAAIQQWRHIPNWPTFQALGFFWCNVTAADATFFERITKGPPFPATTEPEQANYPNCATA